MADAARQWDPRGRGHRARNLGLAYSGHARLIQRAGLRGDGESRSRRGMRTMRMTGMGIGRGRRETAGDQKHRPKRPQQMKFRGHVEPYHDGSGLTNLVLSLVNSQKAKRRARAYSTGRKIHRNTSGFTPRVRG